MSKPLPSDTRRPAQPFPPPRRLPARLTRLQSYWSNLRRGENTVPFSDDVDLSALADLYGNLVLVEVFERPQRFRFSRIDQQLMEGRESNIMGGFAGEVELGRPFEFFLAQASVTVEACAPTFYRHRPTGEPDRGISYSRLLLPTWGNGRVDMLIGAVV